MALSDADLVRKCLNGEDSAYGFLVDKYKGAVHALARKKLSNHHDAEDVAQEVFIKAYQNLPSLKAPNRFAGWLYVITVNECRRHLKKRSKEKEGLISITEGVSLREESRYALQQTKQQLHDVVEILPESCFKGEVEGLIAQIEILEEAEKMMKNTQSLNSKKAESEVDEEREPHKP